MVSLPKASLMRRALSLAGASALLQPAALLAQNKRLTKELGRGKTEHANMKNAIQDLHYNTSEKVQKQYELLEQYSVSVSCGFEV